MRADFALEAPALVPTLSDPDCVQQDYVDGFETRIEGETAHVIFWANCPEVDASGRIIMMRKIVRKIVGPASIVVASRVQIQKLDDILATVNTAGYHSPSRA